MGKFRLSGVIPDNYRLYVFEESHSGPLADIEFFKPFESKAVKLTVEEGERKQVEVTVLKMSEAR